MLLAPLLIGLISAALLAPDPRAISKVIRQGIAALKDPLTLFSQRSPGRRSAGALHALKQSKKPRERVLSVIRERPEAAGMPADVAGPIFEAPTEVPTLPPGLPETTALPEVQPPGAPLFVPPVFVPSGFPSGGPPGGGPPGGGGTPGTPTPTGPVPPSTPTPTPPPGITPTPPGIPLSPPPPIVVIPEPASWTVMMAGFLALILAGRRRPGRRRARKQQA